MHNLPPYKCVIVDDNELDRLLLQDYLCDYPEIKVLATFGHPKEALPFIQQNAPDIIFLDVDMPEMNGIELRQNLLHIPICIFVTDHPQHAVEGFDLEALDYLVKPVKPERFTQTILRLKGVLERLQLQAESRSFYVKDGHQQKKIDLHDVLYIKALQNYSVLHTSQEKLHIHKMISHLLLDEVFEDFIRIHRSYAVNIKHISSVSAKSVTLSSSESINVGRKYKEAVAILPEKLLR